MKKYPLRNYGNVECDDGRLQYSCAAWWCYFALRVCWAESLAKLFSHMDQNSPERVAFVSRALKWSTGGSSKLGHPKLHQLLAVTLWNGKRANCFKCRSFLMLRFGDCHKFSAAVLCIYIYSIYMYVKILVMTPVTQITFFLQELKHYRLECIFTCL